MWKFGLVGFGGLKRSQAYINDPRVEVTAVCDVSTSALERAGDLLRLPEKRLFTDYGDFLSADIDVVVIGTPIPFHAEQAVMAMGAGHHVLSEVTAADTIEGCEAIVDASERTGRTYMLAENYIWFDYVQKWRQWIDRGDLGRIYYAEGEYLHGIRELLVDPSTGERKWRYERPPITYCTHCTGPLLYLMDDRLVRGTGIGDSHWSEPDGGVGHVDMQVAVFETAKGAVVKFLGSQVVAREPYLVHYCLYGTNGVVENGRTGHQKTTGLLYRRDDPSCVESLATIDCDPSDPEAPAEARTGGHGTSEYFLLREFLGAIETGRPAPIDAQRAFELTVPGLVALESIKRGGVWLDVPQVR
jgi:predicted dehydrogenase